MSCLLHVGSGSTAANTAGFLYDFFSKRHTEPFRIIMRIIDPHFKIFLLKEPERDCRYLFE